MYSFWLTSRAATLIFLPSVNHGLDVIQRLDTCTDTSCNADQPGAASYVQRGIPPGSISKSNLQRGVQVDQLGLPASLASHQPPQLYPSINLYSYTPEVAKRRARSLKPFVIAVPGRSAWESWSADFKDSRKKEGTETRLNPIPFPAHPSLKPSGTLLGLDASNLTCPRCSAGRLHHRLPQSWPTWDCLISLWKRESWQAESSLMPRAGEVEQASVERLNNCINITGSLRTHSYTAESSEGGREAAFSLLVF